MEGMRASSRAAGVPPVSLWSHFDAQARGNQAWQMLGVHWPRVALCPPLSSPGNASHSFSLLNSPNSLISIRSMRAEIGEFFRCDETRQRGERSQTDLSLMIFNSGDDLYWFPLPLITHPAYYACCSVYYPRWYSDRPLLRVIGNSRTVRTCACGPEMINR